MKDSKRMELPREVWMGPDTLEKILNTCTHLDLGNRGYLVADKNTHKIAGKRIIDCLTDGGFQIKHSIIDSADEKTAKRVRDKSQDSDFLIGVGGGTCIDLAKYVAFEDDKPFISVPTAASHDGIASSRAAIDEGGESTSIKAQPPIAVIADTLIIRDSPSHLTAAGCGDMIANYTAVLDCELAEKENGDRYSEYAAALSRMSAKIVEKNIEEIKKGTEESARKIVKALISSGVAMSIAGSSRPASGSEHLFSHALDKIAPEPALHGEQCAVGAIMMTKLHEKDWKKIKNALKVVNCPTNAEELGIKPEHIVKALTDAHKIRPNRYTVLRDGLEKEEAEKLAKETEVID